MLSTITGIKIHTWRFIFFTWGW